MPEISPDKTKEFLDAYNSLADAIFRHIYFRIWSRELAKDLMQETFTRTWDYVRKGNEVKNLKSFIYKVANNLVIDEYRKKREISLDMMRSNGFDVENKDQEHILRDVEMSNAREAIKKMEPHYRDVILMRYVQDLTIREIAGIIGQSENVVSVRLNRGVKELRKLLHL